MLLKLIRKFSAIQTQILMLSDMKVEMGILRVEMFNRPGGGGK